MFTSESMSGASLGKSIDIIWDPYNVANFLLTCEDFSKRILYAVDFFKVGLQ